MQSIKEKAISGVLWNSTGSFSSFMIEFIVGIILARLLTPEEFGLIGAITVIIVLSEVFINSGFIQAIIRKPKCNQTDYSTAFIFNIAVGGLFFLILYITAGSISAFFKNSALKPLIQVLGVGLVISSLSLIQQAKLTKQIDFKLQTNISIIAAILSGIAAIIFALMGFGVWSLVIKTLSGKTLTTIMLWYWNKWKPDLVFSIKSFKELFGFGSKLLLSGLIGTFLQNLNYIIIAKYFSPQELGYFTRAEMFKNMPSQNVSSVVTTVGYPVLASLQGDKPLMKEVFRKMFTNTFFIIAVLMVGLAATAKALVLSLIGAQWLPSVELLQLLSFVGLMYPLNSMNINILNVVGRSDLYLKLQLIVQILAIPNIIAGIFLGVKALIVGMIFISLIGYFIFNFESNKVLNYPIKEQLKDIIPSIVISILMGIIVFAIGQIIDLPSIITLIIQIISGFLIIIIISELIKLKEYVFIKETVINKFKLLYKKLFT